MRIQYESPEDRFWAKVAIAGPDECWPWTGARRRGGYGQFQWREMANRPLIASRVAFYLDQGYWPTAVRHRCDNPPCCNPAHLQAGSHAENMNDAVVRNRVAHGRRLPHARLTEDQVREIRRMSLEGASQAEIGRVLEIPSRTVGFVVTGRTWRRVT